MLAKVLQVSERDTDTLQREMEAARSDMASALAELKLAVDPRRQLLLHPWASLAIFAATGVGVAFGLRRFFRNRRIRRTLEQLAAAQGRRIWIF